MLKKIEKLIPAALDAIDQNLVQYDDKKVKVIPSGYQSAIAGFGTSILQMGLLPTLAVYLDKDNKSEIDRKALLDTLFAILLSEKDQLSIDAQDIMENHPKKDDKDDNKNGDFLKAISENASVKNELKTKLMQSALAFKLAIRTYNLVKS